MQQEAAMANDINTGNTYACTASGTLLVVIANLTPGEILKTAILAAIGAVISFIVSKLLQKMWKKFK
jgi:mannitol-specific phosphotransferase system IIBC component